MGFQLVPKSVTLNDHEGHNGHYLAFFTEFGSSEADYVKVVKDRPMQSATEMWPWIASGHPVWSDTTLVDITGLASMVNHTTITDPTRWQPDLCHRTWSLQIFQLTD